MIEENLQSNSSKKRNNLIRELCGAGECEQPMLSDIKLYRSQENVLTFLHYVLLLMHFKQTSKLQ